MNARVQPSVLGAMIVDSFAGGGGASTGIEMALGRSPDVAINHSAAALALHAANHPDTVHLDSNIWDVDPRAVTRGRTVGLLWASPDCKHFSKAKGAAPRDRNIRDLAWVVVRWAETVRPDVILMENVEEFLTWGPVGEDGQPLEWLKGSTFVEWKRRLRAAGYRVQHRELRACDFGAPTIRKRFFLIARRDGRKIVWPKPSHGDPASPAVRRGKLRPWRTAADCIDWHLPCPSIFATGTEIMAEHGLRAVRPLAPNTLARVARGIKRYVLDTERPFLVNTTGHRGYGEAEPAATVTTGGHHGVIVPSITRFNGGATGQDMRDPLATVTANSWIKRPGGAAPLGLLAPVLTYAQHGGAVRGIIEPTHTLTASRKDQNALIAPSLVSVAHGDSGGRREYPLADPMGVVLAGGITNAVMAPSLLSLKGTARRALPVDLPHPAILAQGLHSALVAPALVQTGYGEAPGQAPRCLDLGEPLGTVVAGGVKHALVAPHVMTMRNAQKPYNGADEPAHTITAGGAGLVLVAPAIMGCGGRAAQSRPRGVDEPMATGTAKADACLSAAFLAQHNTGVTGHDPRSPLSTIAATGSHQTPVAAWFAKYYGTGDGAPTDDPMHTVTVRDRLGHVQAALQAPPFGPEHHARARDVSAFLRAHGAWTGGEFVTLTVDGTEFVIVDIGMRMLTPRELYRAQGFPDDYVIEGVWETGAGGDLHWRPFAKDIQVSCCGNSVCPPLAEALVRANCAHLAAMEATPA